MAAKRGYHARIADASKQGRDCAACHTEHFGREFTIARWPEGRQEFRHEETGYRLEGKHAGVACEKCHNTSHVSPEELKTIRVKDPNRTFLGLSTACASCHEDEHRGQLGAECSQCHDFNAWKPASRFDHSQVRFTLTGRHETVACSECHLPAEPPNSYTRYVMEDRNTCGACHRDPHLGAFRQSCETCHTAVSWQPGAQITRFDHSSTAFPLVGKHAGVSCSECHSSVKFSEPIAHGRCMDCHTPDPHKGQFQERADGGDCSACHDEKGFKPTLFSVSLHQETAYPLLGRHREVKCDQCHLPAGADTKFRIDHEQCHDCHEDAHAGQFSAEPHFDRCEDCHSVEGFHPSTFTETKHRETRFPLAGSHRAVACIECHSKDPSPRDGHRRFRFNDLACSDCHEDPHGGQFTAVASSNLSSAQALSCASCHTERSWQETARFDHAQTAFPLAGAHQGVGCMDCHRSSTPQTGLENVVFNAAPRACVRCHEDVHGSQFDRDGVGGDCGRCHTPSDWKRTTFDHEKYSSFSLTGAHEKVSCSQCHLSRADADRRTVTVYRGTPRECSACHSNEQLKDKRLRKNFGGR